MRGCRVILTDKFITAKDRVPAKGSSPVDFWDAMMPGLGLRVSDTGTRTFIIMARRTRLRIGSYPIMTLAEAREKARAWLLAFQDGRDPRQEERQRREESQSVSNTFGYIAEDYISLHVRKLKQAGNIEGVWRREFIPKWGDRKAADIPTAEIAGLIRNKAATAPGMARVMLKQIKYLYQWAVDSHAYGLTNNPPSTLKAKTLCGEQKSRQRILSDDELRKVWAAAETMGYPWAPFIKALLMTGLREREVAGAIWGEFDLAQGIWIIAPERMKGGTMHMVPLAAMMLTLLKSLPKFVGPYIFSTASGQKPMKNLWHMKAKLDELSGVTGWTLHDLRRTARSHFSALARREVAEAVIAHRPKGIIGVYDLYSFSDEKRECLTLWEARLGAILTPKPPTEVADISNGRAA